MNKAKLLLIVGTSGMLSSCDLSQIPGLDKRLSLEDSRAVGAACRHSGRALEDCFALNPSTHPAGVFDGWRDMNDYMTANKIETVMPEIQSSKFSSSEKNEQQAGAQGSSTDSSAPLAEAPERPRFDPRMLGSAAGGQAEVSSPEPSDKKTATPEAGIPPRPWERQRDGKNTT